MIRNITIGADPELFIYDSTTNKVVSSIGLIPGKKGEAYTENMPEGFGLQIDNILAEFNVPPLSIIEQDKFIENIEYMKEWIHNYVSEKNSNYTIKCAASEMVDADQLQSEEAKEFGCSPDYNAYTRKQNPKPKGTKTNLRTTGFHIHIGYDNPNIEESIKIVLAMDMFLGIPSIVKDTDTRRRKLYGKAGCFRLTDYGVEYRVLSGYFLSSPELVRWVHSQTIKAIDWVKYQDMEPVPLDVMEKVINSGDVEEATRLIKEYKLEN